MKPLPTSNSKSLGRKGPLSRPLFLGYLLVAVISKGEL